MSWAGEEAAELEEEGRAFLVGEARLRVENEGTRDRMENEERDLSSVSMRVPSAKEKDQQLRRKKKRKKERTCLREVHTRYESVGTSDNDSSVLDALHKDGTPALYALQLELVAPFRCIFACQLGAVEQRLEGERQDVEVPCFRHCVRLEVLAVGREGERGCCSRDETGGEDEADWREGPRVLVQVGKCAAPLVILLHLDLLPSTLAERDPSQFESESVLDDPA